MNRIIAAVVAAGIATVAIGTADALAKGGKGNGVTRASNINQTGVKARLHPSPAVKKALNDALHECKDCLQGSGD